MSAVSVRAQRAEQRYEKGKGAPIMYTVRAREGI